MARGDKQDCPQLGKLIERDASARRDAIHIAVAPLLADEELRPGQRIGLWRNGTVLLATSRAPHVAIVDPFLTENVPRGAQFYACLIPYTVTSLRHVWTHPAFATPLPGLDGGRAD